MSNIFNRSFRRKLEIESLSWVEQGMIQIEQRQNILSLYPTKTASLLNLSIFLSIALFGFALILLLSHNWENLSRLTKFSMVLLGLASIHLRGLWLYKKGRMPEALRYFFLACFMHGVGIWLTAQIYHLDDRLPNGILLWAFGVLPYLAIFPSAAFLNLAAPLVCLWIFHEFTLPWSGSLLCYPLFLWAFINTLKNKPMGFISHFFPALSFFLWIENLISWQFSTILQTKPLLLHIILFVCTLFSLTEKSPHHYEQIRHSLIKILIFILLIISYEDPLRHLLNLHGYRAPNTAIVLFAFYAIIQCWVVLRLPKPSKVVRIILGAQAALATILIIRFILHDNYGDLITLLPFLRILVNIAILTIAVLLIGGGIQKQCISSFYTGVGYIILLALCRYFDLIGSYIGGAFAFAVSGLVLYLSSKYFASKQGEEKA